MQFSFYPPSTHLKNYVERYWAIDGHFDNYQKTTPPFIGESWAFFIQNKQDWDIGFLNAKTYQLKSIDSGLIGQPTRDTLHHLNGNVATFVVHFKPAAFFELFGVSKKGLSDQFTLMEDVLGKKVRELEEQIQLAANHQQRVPIIEHFLVNWLKSKKNHSGFGSKATQWILRQKGITTVEKLCDSFCVTERTLQRRFLEEIGIAPKLFASLVRQQNIIQTLSLYSRLNWQDLVVDLGFHDQAHFVKNFKQFAGLTPAAYLAQRNEIDKFLFDF